jgi:Glycosyl transferase family group 2
MFLNPEVAIIQHSTGVMQVSRDYFENGITYFTNLIYSAIRFAVGSGETAPFVGHNAFLRWQGKRSTLAPIKRVNIDAVVAAVQSVGRPDDGYTAFWSESHVSEDFDIALRLQIQGNIIRLASYHNDEFKEGVSLTIYDELSRWEK